MKPIINRVFALCAFVLMLALPHTSQAQVGLAVNSYFGTSNTNMAFCQARTIVTGASVQGAVNFGAPQGSVAIQVTTLTTEDVIYGKTSITYALASGWGYWMPAGTGNEIPVLVEGQFSQSSAGLAALSIQVTNFNTGALVYSSGTLVKTGKNVIAIGYITTPVLDDSPPSSHMSPTRTNRVPRKK